MSLRALRDMSISILYEISLSYFSLMCTFFAGPVCGSLFVAMKGVHGPKVVLAYTFV